MNDLTTEIKKLEIETLDNLKLSKAKNTIRAYKSDFNDFVLFCSKHGMKSMPSDPKIISLYLTHLSKKSKYLRIFDFTPASLAGRPARPASQ